MACDSSFIHNTKYYRAEALGEGSYGSVITVYDDNGDTYALKLFSECSEKTECSEKNTTESERDIELGTLREISTLRMLPKHPNVMSMHDICIFDGALALVMPKMTSNLYDAIEAGYLSQTNKLNIAHGLVSAVAFLHVNLFIHRDIKTENVLLDFDLNPVLADFSLTKIFVDDQSQRTHTNPIGTCGYIAPEVVDDLPYGLPSDSWGVGVVLLELFGGLLNIDKDRAAIAKIQELTDKMTDKPVPSLLKGFLKMCPSERLRCDDALLLPVFAKFKNVVYERTVTCSLEPPITCYRRSKEEKKSKLSRKFEAFCFDNPMTLFAAEKYFKEVSESKLWRAEESCLILASKLYEEDLIDLYEIKDFDILKYISDEKKIFEAMGYCLFV